ncbi:MAG: 16S rRNA (guanine(966)-N(2))-methyltransferase RsmD [Anaerolineae bacterium]
MRVIAGRAKGRRLMMVPGEGTRPITDRAKEALFSILGTTIMNARVLDLFAGTGGVGIEALSRGAAHVTFVERAGKAVDILRQNLSLTGLTSGAEVVRADVFRFLEGAPRAPYDLIYVAPPQYQGLWLKTLQALDARPDWLAADGEVVVQIFPKEYTEPALQTLALVDERKYGSVLLLFYERGGGIS